MMPMHVQSIWFLQGHPFRPITIIQLYRIVKGGVEWPRASSALAHRCDDGGRPWWLRCSAGSERSTFDIVADVNCWATTCTHASPHMYKTRTPAHILLCNIFTVHIQMCITGAVKRLQLKSVTVWSLWTSHQQTDQAAVLDLFLNQELCAHFDSKSLDVSVQSL